MIDVTRSMLMLYAYCKAAITTLGVCANCGREWKPNHPLGCEHSDTCDIGNAMADAYKIQQS